MIVSSDNTERGDEINIAICWTKFREIIQSKLLFENIKFERLYSHDSSLFSASSAPRSRSCGLDCFEQARCALDARLSCLLDIISVFTGDNFSESDDLEKEFVSFSYQVKFESETFTCLFSSTLDEYQLLICNATASCESGVIVSSVSPAQWRPSRLSCVEFERHYRHREIAGILAVDGSIVPGVQSWKYLDGTRRTGKICSRISYIEILKRFLFHPPPPCRLSVLQHRRFLWNLVSKGSAFSVAAAASALRALGSCCGNIALSNKSDMAMAAARSGNAQVISL